VSNTDIALCNPALQGFMRMSEDMLYFSKRRSCTLSSGRAESNGRILGSTSTDVVMTDRANDPSG